MSEFVCVSIWMCLSLCVCECVCVCVCERERERERERESLKRPCESLHGQNLMCVASGRRRCRCVCVGGG